MPRGSLSQSCSPWYLNDLCSPTRSNLEEILRKVVIMKGIFSDDGEFKELCVDADCGDSHRLSGQA